VIQTSNTGEKFELPAEGEPRLQVAAWMTEDAVRQLVSLAGKDLDKLIEAARTREFEPVPLGITTSIAFSNKLDHIKTANVLGLLPGSDPGLRKEVVVYSAHHDHFGIGKADRNGDKIYNGALDNGSGVAMLLAIANACKAMPAPPKRSVLFAFVAAEEQGLLGSKYYTMHPTFPPDQIVADINYDSGNKWGKTRDVTFIGYGKSSIDKIADALAADQGRVVKPDQFPDRGYFYRSDQYNFAKIGVPAMFLTTGTDFIGRPPGWGREQVEYYEDHNYHQPSDELNDDWNFDGMVQDARLGFLTGVKIANADQRPAWVPGDEFEKARSNVYKTEILNTEVAFARLVKAQGMKTGFLTYAADSAVLNRSNKLIKGKKEMAAYFDRIKLKNISLDWYPDFIEVSDAGDLGYTYGHYTFTATNTEGKPVQDAGIFHTVWKRQADGKWRFVWD
jgi:Zn-dependent M28 family amino/carboxypeptidase